MPRWRPNLHAVQNGMWRCDCRVCEQLGVKGVTRKEAMAWWSAHERTEKHIRKANAARRDETLIEFIWDSLFPEMR